MENTKMDRVLEIFFRGLRGEDLSVQQGTVCFGGGNDRGPGLFQG